MRLAQTLLDRYVRVCSTVRANMGISRDLEGEGKVLEKRAVKVAEEWRHNGASVEGQDLCE
jgi:hypothetical protein